MLARISTAIDNLCKDATARYLQIIEVERSVAAALGRVANVESELEWSGFFSSMLSPLIDNLRRNNNIRRDDEGLNRRAGMNREGGQGGRGRGRGLDRAGRRRR